MLCEKIQKSETDRIAEALLCKAVPVGKLKKRPYSQVWKYKDDIKKMEKLQQQYLFLVRHDVHSVEELALTVANLTDKRKEASSDKSRVYRARQRCKSLFDIAGQLDMLECAEKCFQNGDNFFIEEHRQWMELTKKLSEEGYSYEEIKKLRAYYKEQIAYVSNREWASAKSLIWQKQSGRTW